LLMKYMNELSYTFLVAGLIFVVYLIVKYGKSKK